MNIERIFRRNKPYTRQEIEKAFNKKAKKIYKELSDEEMKQYVGIDKTEIENTHKRSKFKEFMSNIIKNIKEIFMFFIDNGPIIIKYITSFDGLLKTIKGIAKFIFEVRKYLDKLSGKLKMFI